MGVSSHQLASPSNLFGSEDKFSEKSIAYIKKNVGSLYKGTNKSGIEKWASLTSFQTEI